MNNIESLITELRVIAVSTELEILSIKHEPLSGGYLGFIRFDGVKNNLRIKIDINLDFINENDGISLRVYQIKNPSGDLLKDIKDSIGLIKDDYTIPYSEQWFNLISKEINIRSNYYN